MAHVPGPEPHIVKTAARSDHRSDEFRIPKKSVGVLFGVLIFLFIVVGSVRSNAVYTIWSFIVPASAQFVVLDSATDTPVAGATITVNRQTLTTDEAGKAQVYRLWPGSIPYAIDAPGYIVLKANASLVKGLNDITAELEKDVRSVTLNGRVIDYVTDKPLEGVTVKTGDQEAVSNVNGEVTFERIPVGTVDLTLSKDDYRDTPISLDLDDDAVQDLAIIPKGVTVFTSNRDEGKHGLFVSDYAGKTVQALTLRIGDTEDTSPVVGPNNILVAFLSTRDKRTPSGSETYDPKLYVVGTDGMGLKKLSDSTYINSVEWSATGKFLTWTGGDSYDSGSKNHLWLYDPIKGATHDLASSGGLSYYHNHAGDKIAWTQNPYQDGQGETGLYYRDLPTGEIKRISDQSIYTVEWAADDTSIEFSYYDQGAQREVHKEYHLGTSVTKDYTPEAGETYRTTVASPDGSQVAYIEDRDGQVDLFVNTHDLKKEKRLTQLGTLVGNPIWDRSGRYLLIDSSKTGETARYIVGAGGGTPKKITDISLDYSGGYGH